MKIGFSKDEAAPSPGTFEEAASPILPEFEIKVRGRIEAKVADFGISVEDMATRWILVKFSQSEN